MASKAVGWIVGAAAMYGISRLLGPTWGLLFCLVVLLLAAAYNFAMWWNIRKGRKE